MRLQLESTTDILDLGTRALAALMGVTGAGLPPVATQWFEGAGDGASYRGERVLARDIDLPISATTADRAEMRALTSRISKMLSGPMVLRFVEDDGSSWTLDVRRVGGGNLALGLDTDAETWLSTVVTLRAGDPFWTSSETTRHETIASSGRGLLFGATSLSALRVSPSQTLGEVVMENLGDAYAYPVWTIHGPGQNFTATSATGESFQLWSILAAGDTITIDTRRATVTDQLGISRYFELAPAPQLWRIPPGITTADVSMTNTTSASRIVAEWRARRWTVV